MIRCPGFVQQRYVLVFLGFIGFIFNYCLRVNINLIITSMVKENSIELNSTDTQENYSDLFDWDSKDRNDIISAFFYGYIVLQVPGGRMAELIGGKRVQAIAMGLTAALTLLIPTAANLGGKGKNDYPYYLVALRVFMGICEGATFPGITSMMARWAPLSERARMTTFIMAGSQAGTLVGFFLSGLMIDAFGWENTFYIEGGCCFVWLAFWILLVYDTPEQHPFISKQELDHIKAGLPSTDKVSPPVPWMSIVMSPPFWAILVANFSNNWGFHLLMTELPQYLSEVFKDEFSDSSTIGLWTSLPYLGMWISSLVFASICDVIIKKKWVTTATARKIFNTLSQSGPATCLLIITFSVSVENTMLTLTLGLFILCVTLQGGLYSGWMVNSQDIAPNFAGTIYGITNGIGNIPGFVAPKIAGILVNEDPTDPTRWKGVWITTASISFVCSIFYIIFGAGNTQPWNNIDATNTDSQGDGRQSKAKQDEEGNNQTVVV